MSISRIMKWITGIFEALLGFPILGGAFIISNLWGPLFVMLVLHIITLILSRRDGGATAGSIIGILTSLIGWIPGIGMIMHLITAVVLIITGMMPDNQSGD
ncbi:MULTISPECIES: hypothetical protein [Virgibacillus]|uniref:Uncharacterized protein n=2 Tax=Virgibacillus TaxID=84406 RepID=A0A024Q8S8_9BACI|nr:MULTISPECIES: hypothetical protein [Virgibacillus]EQB38160.1 hypothetical protein M948_06180 [Virgibacillus sp. CM-4]MYL40866.1 hypothetical protein [Virgibacillus massiliensis]GGJ52437.1 hypothetical protein GCM10007111_13210 [Virgibacillus kapii]CDQ38336.1 hypothetical protein BN990_00605 [Virgibacillus massiliensis]